MNSLFHWFCNPIFLFGILLSISLCLKLLKKDRGSSILLVTAIAWIAIVSSTPLAQWMVYSLEKECTPFEPANALAESPGYVLVLGGGHTIWPGMPASMQLSGTAMVRLAEGIRVQRQLEGSKLVCSGASASKRVTQAEMLSLAALEVGFSAQDTLQSRSPSRTVEEIQAFKKRFGVVPLVVVTSARHIPRVMAICKKEGLVAIPAPTDYMLKRDPLVSQFEFYPSVQKMVMMESALHEYLGILEIQVRGLWND